MVKSEKLFSPQEYLEKVTGNYYQMDSDDDVQEIEKITESLGLSLWSYPLSEIGHIVENDINVVLVQCMVYNEKEQQFSYVNRWFEVQENFE